MLIEEQTNQRSEANKKNHTKINGHVGLLEALKQPSKVDRYHGLVVASLSGVRRTALGAHFPEQGVTFILKVTSPIGRSFSINVFSSDGCRDTGLAPAPQSDRIERGPICSPDIIFVIRKNPHKSDVYWSCVCL
jgi:hypothetical protein